MVDDAQVPEFRKPARETGIMKQVSRVHELARLSALDLRTLYIRMIAEPGSMAGPHSKEMMSAGWDRDQLVTAIRDIEDPRLLCLIPFISDFIVRERVPMPIQAFAGY